MTFARLSEQKWIFLTKILGAKQEGKQASKHNPIIGIFRLILSFGDLDGDRIF